MDAITNLRNNGLLDVKFLELSNCLLSDAGNTNNSTTKSKDPKRFNVNITTSDKMEVNVVIDLMQVLI